MNEVRVVLCSWIVGLERMRGGGEGGGGGKEHRNLTHREEGFTAWVRVDAPRVILAVIFMVLF